ncbi:MAG: hypothetical protein IJ300_04110 [Clostridia bacterium]|nr:hypothetical protein [Clostridia bacterium]
MKKLLCVFICIVLLAGCEKPKDDENEFAEFYGFSTCIKATVNEINIVADAKYDLLNGLEIIVREPDSANEMIVKLKDGECEINFQELSFSFSSSGLPPNSPFIALERLAKSISTMEKQGNFYKFTCENETYYLYTNENGFYKLSTESNTILFFENFKFVNVQT